MFSLTAIFQPPLIRMRIVVRRGAPLHRQERPAPSNSAEWTRYGTGAPVAIRSMLLRRRTQCVPRLCKSGTFLLACGLRWAGCSLVGAVVKSLTFTIDPAAHWNARQSGPRVPRNLLPFFWMPRTRGGPQPERLDTPARSIARSTATCPGHVHSPIMRNLLKARLTCTTFAIRRINRSSYKSYSISTTQNENGIWAAAYGPRDSDLIEIGRTKQAVRETASEVAEVIAIADAQIAIDDRLAGKAR